MCGKHCPVESLVVTPHLLNDLAHATRLTEQKKKSHVYLNDKLIRMTRTAKHFAVSVQ